MRHILLLMTVCGCVGTETGNPITSEGTTSDSTTAALVATDGSALVEQAWISVASVRAILGDACDHLGSAGHGATGDLLTNLEFSAPVEETSCGVHLVVGLAGSTPGAPSAFEGSAGLVVGRRSDGTPFELRTTAIEGMNVLGAPGLDLATQSFVISFDVARWIQAVDLTVDPDADGVVRIANASFDAAWVQAVELFVDEDGDGRLSVDERSRGPVAMSHR